MDKSLLALIIAQFILGEMSYGTHGFEGCMDLNEAYKDSIIFTGCNQSLNHPSIFIYSVNYDVVKQNLGLLEQTVESSSFTSNFCDLLIRNYLCNYVYPPCSENETTPIGICEDDCEMFVNHEGECSFEIGFLLSLPSAELKDLTHCSDTLLHLETVGVDVNKSMECIHITPNEIQAQPTTPAIVLSLPVVISIPVAVVVLVTFAVTLTVVHTVYRWKKSKETKNLESRSSETPSSNLYHFSGFNGFPSHEYDAPLFQLSHEDVMDNAILKNAVLPFEWLYVEEEIGHGEFGSVFKGRILPKSEVKNRTINIQVAIKTIKNSSASYSELKGFLEESMLMCEFNHPHVLGLIGISLDSNHSPYLLLPFMENGDLREFLKNKRGTSVSNITRFPMGLNCEALTRICIEIAEGMEYLAEKKLVHRDLAARNCMVDGNMSIKVADFGLTRDIYQTDYYRQNHRSRVPIKWMAPESLYDRISNEKTDVWSYGVTCWEVFSLGRTPYPTISNADMLTYLEHGHRLQKPFLCPEQMFSLIMSCWREDPQDRPKFSEICHALSTPNTCSTLSSGLPTIEEESLLDSVMSVMAGKIIHEGCKEGVQDEYVDVDPQHGASAFNELIEDVDNCASEDKIMETVHIIHSMQNDTIKYSQNTSELISAGATSLDHSVDRDHKDSIYNDRYVDMSGANSQQVPHNLSVTGEDGRVSHNDHSEHVRQSSTVSDYVTMDPA